MTYYGSISFNIQVFLTQLFKQLSDSTLESRLNLTNVEESQVFHLCCYILDYQNILHYVTYLLQGVLQQTVLLIWTGTQRVSNLCWLRS